MFTRPHLNVVLCAVHSVDSFQLQDSNRHAVRALGLITKCAVYENQNQAGIVWVHACGTYANEVFIDGLMDCDMMMEQMRVSSKKKIRGVKIRLNM